MAGHTTKSIIAKIVEAAILKGACNATAANEARRFVPGARTTSRGAAWYRARLRKQGYSVPRSRRR